jgi:hypothetical protein
MKVKVGKVYWSSSLSDFSPWSGVLVAYGLGHIIARAGGRTSCSRHSGGETKSKREGDARSQGLLRQAP